MAHETEIKKMIQIRIHLFTNDLAPQKGAVLPKHAWELGWISLPANRKHGIPAGHNKRFKTLLQLPAKIEELLKENGITIHLSASKKYMTTERPGKNTAT